MENKDIRLTIEINADLKKSFKVAVTEQGSNMKETVESLIIQYLKNP